MFRIAFLAIVLSLSVFADEPTPEPISDEQFIVQIKAACQVAKEKNDTVEFLGFGTANLLATNRPSKTRCGVGNPNPKTGECSDSYPIRPDVKGLEKVIQDEKMTKPEIVKKTKAVWAAWKGSDGVVSIAFNSPAVGIYELSTIFEVAEDWESLRIYYISVRYGPSDEDWQQACQVNKAWFIRLRLGEGGTVKDRLQALTDVGVISDAIITSEATPIASKEK